MQSSWAVIGVGNQGTKHVRALGERCAIKVDTPDTPSGLKQIGDASANFEFAVVATPESAKERYVTELLKLGKFVLVEKPLPCDRDLIGKWTELIERHRGGLMASYDHQHDPGVREFLSVVERIKAESPRALEWSRVEAHYGFGTAELIRRSAWMDFGTGPWELVAPHILKLLLSIGDYSFSDLSFSFGFSDNRAPSTVIATLDGMHSAAVSTSYVHWKNSFSVSYFHPDGFVQLTGLGKWANSELRIWKRNEATGPPELETERFFEPLEDTELVTQSQRFFLNSANEGSLPGFADDEEIYNAIILSRNALRNNPSKSVPVVGEPI